jgi:hypothetical protein
MVTTVTFNMSALSMVTMSRSSWAERNPGVNEMRIPITCMSCFQERGSPREILAVLEVTDDGRYEFICDQGHKTTTVLQNQKFEVLFEIALHAIHDGYYRDAVSSFAASLERFYEFAIRIFLRKSEIEQGLIEESWKKINGSSERQLGAFCFLWLSHFQAVPSLLSDKCVSFRNKVIHQGKIPTRSEATSFGAQVLSTIQPKILQLAKAFPDELQKSVFAHLRSASRPTDRNVSTLSLNTLVSLSRSPVGTESVEDYLLGLQKLRQLWGR